MICRLSNHLLKNKQGFTLVELVVVLLILGIIGINIGTRFFSSSSFSERKVADELIDAIRYTQHLAMSRSSTFRIVTSSNSYSVQDAGGIAIANPNRSGDYTVSVPSNTSLSAITISFNGLGQPTPTTDSNIVIGSGTPFTITVEGETGYAHY